MVKGAGPVSGGGSERDRLLVDAIAHELRSPLTSIAGMADTLLNPEASRLSQDDRQSLLARIAANAARMEAVLANLLDVGRDDEGALSVNRQPTDMAALVSRVVEELDLSGHAVDVSVEMPVACVDPFLAERVVHNLVANAVRHTASGTRIEVRVRRAGPFIELTVSDDGPGIASEHREVIFERFRQGDTPRGGAGLGLFLVRRFAEIHGGRAWVDDDDDGPGASFHVLLARSEGKRSPAGSGMSAGGPGIEPGTS